MLMRLGCPILWATRNSCFACSRNFSSSLSSTGTILRAYSRESADRRTCKMVLWAPLPRVPRTWYFPIEEIVATSRPPVPDVGESYGPRRDREATVAGDRRGTSQQRRVRAGLRLGLGRGLRARLRVRVRPIPIQFASPALN